MAKPKIIECSASITIRTPPDLKREFQEALAQNEENLSVFFRGVMREYLRQYPIKNQTS